MRTLREQDMYVKLNKTLISTAVCTKGLQHFLLLSLSPFPDFPSFDKSLRQNNHFCRDNSMGRVVHQSPNKLSVWVPCSWVSSIILFTEQKHEKAMHLYRSETMPFLRTDWF